MLRQISEFFGYELPPTREQILKTFQGPNYWRSEDAVVETYCRDRGTSYEQVTEKERDRIFQVLMRLHKSYKLEFCCNYLLLSERDRAWAVYSSFEQRCPDLFTSVNNYFRLPRYENE